MLCPYLRKSSDYPNDLFDIFDRDCQKKANDQRAIAGCRLLQQEHNVGKKAGRAGLCHLESDRSASRETHCSISNLYVEALLLKVVRI